MHDFFFISIIISCEILSTINGNPRINPKAKSWSETPNTSHDYQRRNHINSSSIPDEKWDYIEVRPGAHMFWWFHGYIGQSKSRQDIPLVLWMNGGPGDSSVGRGSFYQIGPVQMNLTPRQNTWLKQVNLLFIDYPVGVGFSYVSYPSAYSTTDVQVGQDLYHVIAEVLRKITALQNVPLYIIGESYGGKIGAILGHQLIQGNLAGQIQCNFRGTILSSPFISPMDTAASYGPFLYAMSLIDDTELNQLNQHVEKIKSLIATGNNKEASRQFYVMLYIMLEMTANVNIYYVRMHFPINIFARLVNTADENSSNNNNNPSEMYKTMNGPIRKKLGIIPENITFADSNPAVGSYLDPSFVTEVTEYVDHLLAANVSVMIVNGQFDGIVNILSYQKWLKKLKWSHLNQFSNTQKLPVYDSNERIVGYKQSYKNLEYCTILDTGHSPTLRIPYKLMEPFQPGLT
ncbi:uncharacterized protein TRIADDRAFT_21045 [Trichoplax adhaerens]|uniref:Carboxypeptidase n=1 Tax=Trichoplax adhaerens TaxID=10228 RepID=B3RNJ6_TRIAD|nr:hypothetical protein TRIADDRAFT_21045 [Trichoplax adhaerens]EDV27464.1 hypothetical protein TRIADDRAFT_21045 [Trichoplax adhaerens]|eukprot:XP_002109298.1 hypothetical protein TRIADDRAFT_21045 [Trichoplax adhaerens]